MRPKIAVTLGDPAGIGPEIVARACADSEVADRAEIIVVGRHMLLRAGALAAGIREPEVALVEAGQGAEIRPGQPTAASGRQAGAFVEKALELVQSGQAAGMATAPISKMALQRAGYPDTGHTTLLARLTKSARPVMMLAGPNLRVALATIHISLREVPERLNVPDLVGVAGVVHRDLQRWFGIASPRVAVAALNPHAGEEGLFGDEEERVIAPAVEVMRQSRIAATGPLPPDTVFRRAALGEFDAVLAMYHDQGLIPFKLLHFENGVNVTLGLPVIRTSVDHGTAYELAGTGQANPASMKAAILMAASMAQRNGGVPPQP